MGHRPPTSVGIRKPEGLPLRCGTKKPAVDHLVLTQCTRLTDRQKTAGWTDLWEQYRALCYMRHGKNAHPINVHTLY